MFNETNAKASGYAVGSAGNSATPAMPREIDSLMQELGNRLQSLTSNIRQVSNIADRISGPEPTAVDSKQADTSNTLLAQVRFLIHYIEGLDSDLSNSVSRISRVL